MDMKRDDRRRAMARVRVHFRARFSASTRLEGTGRLVDLSLGCRIESAVPMESPMSLRLHIFATGIGRPLKISAARRAVGERPDLRAGRFSDDDYRAAPVGANGQRVELIGDGPRAG